MPGDIPGVVNLMPIVKCEGCGRLTNTAVSSVSDFQNWGKKADGCAAAYENGKWVKGCQYNGSDEAERKIVDGLISGDPAP